MGRNSVTSAVPTSTLFRSRDLSDGMDNDSEESIKQQILFGDQKMWSVHGDSYFPCDKAEKRVPAGQYIPMYSEQRGVYLVKKDVNLDELLVLPDSQGQNVLNSINDFWSREKFFRQFNFLWKRGMLLYGPPGSGKTSLLQQLSMQIIEKDGISVYCNSPAVTAEALRVFRRIEKHRPVVVLIEDIDAVIQRFGEPDLLALLDGELQIDNVVYIATTNYPDELDDRFVRRPSRFDEVLLIDMPSPQAREAYLKVKNPRLAADQEELDRWVNNTKDFSIAALKEVVVSIECLGKSFSETIERIKAMVGNRPTGEDARGKMRRKVGFSVD